MICDQHFRMRYNGLLNLSGTKSIKHYVLPYRHVWLRAIGKSIGQKESNILANEDRRRGYLTPTLYIKVRKKQFTNKQKSRIPFNNKILIIFVSTTKSYLIRVYNNLHIQSTPT